jgi:outer membrane cobalamin receptor
VTSRHEEPYEFVSSPAHIEEDPNIVRRQDQLAFGCKYHHELSNVFSYEASFSAYNSTSRFLNDDDDGSGTPEFRFTSEATVLTGRAQVTILLEELLAAPDSKSRLIAGFEGTWEDTLTASSFGLTPDNVQNRAGYLQVRHCFFRRVLVSAGLRVDGHSTYGTNESPGVGVKIDTWEGGTIRSNWSRAFRPPNSAELTDPWVGNPDLKKERRNGFDVGVSQQLGDKKMLVELTYFQNEIDDNIGYDSTTFRMENFDTHAEGIEVYARLAPCRDLLIDAAFTHVQTRNLKLHEPLAGRSPNFGSIRITRQFGALAVTLTGYFSEKVPPESILDEKGQIQENIGKVDLVNTAFLYKLNEGTSLILKLTNLFDKRYRESERAPRVPGFGAFLGFSTEF